jgi:hypothetical protein
MSDLTPALREEIARHLRASSLRQGLVVRDMERGLSPEQMASSQGTSIENARNYLRGVQDVLNGRLPTAPSIALKAARTYHYLLGCDLSPGLRSYVTSCLRQLKAINPKVSFDQPYRPTGYRDVEAKPRPPISSDVRTEPAARSLGDQEFEPFLRALLDRHESQILERKSSFLVPTDPRQKDIPQHVIQHAVAKNVAALANTNGGHVIIGQADDKAILGLASDFAQLRNPSPDGFELKLVEYINNCLHPGWATLGLRVHWLNFGDREVAIIEVPKSRTRVYLTDKKVGAAEDIYVRSATRTDKLSGRALAD